MAKQIISNIQRLDQLIRIKATGSPSNLAMKLEVSERCIYNYINLMKDLGAPIKFCRYRKSYYYDFKGKLSIAFIKD